MTAPVSTVGQAVAARQAAASSAAGQHLTFGDVLSVLNPLQYLPVVGTIYRAVTGDTIPEPIRQIGGMVVSGLMGGPVGLAIDVLTTVAEEITGIDPDRIGQALLHGESLGAAIAGRTDPATPNAPPHEESPPAGRASTTAPPSTPGNRTALGPPAPPTAWTAAQLAAYGIRADAAGTLRMGTLHGADALNALELAQLHTAQAAYARSAALTH